MNDIRDPDAAREAAFRLRHELSRGGRPPLEPGEETVQRSVRLSRPDYERVRSVADALSVSWSEAFRQILRGAVRHSG